MTMTKSIEDLATGLLQQIEADMREAFQEAAKEREEKTKQAGIIAAALKSSYCEVKGLQPHEVHVAIAFDENSMDIIIKRTPEVDKE